MEPGTPLRWWATPADGDPSVVRPLWTPDGPQTSRYPTELLELAARQSGVAHRHQLTRLGWSVGRLEHELAIGRWSRVAPSVVALQNGPLDTHQLCWLGVLHAGHESALSHLTAARAAGLRWTGDERVHVMTRKGDLVGSVPGLTFHQTRRHYLDWVLPDAQPRQLALEPAALLAAERQRSARVGIGVLAAAVQQGLTTPDRLLETLKVISKLRHGQLFRLALGDIAGGAQSFAEVDLGNVCRDFGLVLPDRQVKRKDRSGRPRYLDAEWDLPDGTVVVLEVDGGFHMLVEHWIGDMKRERSIAAPRRVVMRCGSVELRVEPQVVVADLVAVGVPRVDTTRQPDSSVVGQRASPPQTADESGGRGRVGA